MTAENLLLVLVFVGLTAYALFAGADFGAGFWDLLERRGTTGQQRRGLIEHVIGPVWEANHVWLIFVIVIMWTAFPPAFASAASTLYVPLTLAAFGIILRGSAFAFRKVTHGQRGENVLGRIFGLSSVLTPFFLGAAAGAIASGRVPPGNAAGDVIASWLNPTSVLAGTLAVVVCADLAAVYLTREAQRDGLLEAASVFRVRALFAGVLAGAIALLGIAIVAIDAPTLAAGLRGPALPLVFLSAVSGISALWLVWSWHFTAARVSAALSAGGILWAWGVAQYPYLLADQMGVSEAAANPTTLAFLIGGITLGAILVLPSLAALYLMFERPRRSGRPDDLPPIVDRGDGSSR